MGANDPVWARNKRADTSSIFALAKDRITDVVYGHRGRWPALSDQIIETCGSQPEAQRGSPPHYHFGVEDGAVSGLLRGGHAARRRPSPGEYLPIVEINSTQNGRPYPLPSSRFLSKTSYIKSAKHKALSFKQMKEYPMARNDDAPDGLQMALQLALDIQGRR